MGAGMAPLSVSTELSPEIRFKISRSEDRLLKLVWPFLNDFYRYHYNDHLSFQEAISRSVNEHPEALIVLDIETQDKGINIHVNESLIYPRFNLAAYELWDTRETNAEPLIKGHEQVIKLAKLISSVSNGALTLQEIEKLFSQAQLDEVFLKLAKGNSFRPREEKKLNLDRKGIHRLQHANLLFHSGKTKILTDPHFHSFDEPGNINGITYSELPAPDAILITHSHGDHYDLASLALFDRKTKIFFPKVHRGTILCPDICEELSALGFNELFPLEGNYQPITVGDMTITPAPFFGEQATHNEPPHRPDVKNFGLTYIIEFEGKKSWLLADSGKDGEGDMIHVAGELRKKIGAIDHVFSCFREIKNRTPFYLTNGATWLTLSTEQMKKHSAGSPSLTLGVEGLSMIMDIFPEADIYPYAHMWSSYGHSPELDQQEIPKLRALSRNEEKICAWKIGDSINCY